MIYCFQFNLQQQWQPCCQVTDSAVFQQHKCIFFTLKSRFGPDQIKFGLKQNCPYPIFNHFSVPSAHTTAWNIKKFGPCEFNINFPKTCAIYRFIYLFTYSFICISFIHIIHIHIIYLLIPILKHFIIIHYTIITFITLHHITFIHITLLCTDCFYRTSIAMLARSWES